MKKTATPTCGEIAPPSAGRNVKCTLPPHDYGQHEDRSAGRWIIWGRESR